MFSRRGQPPPEDPSVAPVEEILKAAASRSSGEVTRRDGRLIVTHAIWLCACETMDQSPLWLIYAVGEDGLGWQRVAEPEVSDVVEAEYLTGCHPAPEGVLVWLRGDQPYPWRGPADFPEQSFIYEELRRRVHSI
ncbi:hypothetical protein [Nocardioides limicola]|uniref:hypothetical protein n=1 Tax=Nocardioides limicola TaxID=2803368 RepID=UPI00193BA9FC|nr:hypothetical protein [Nocardioides sp. DJM-14]